MIFATVHAFEVAAYAGQYEFQLFRGEQHVVTITEDQAAGEMMVCLSHPGRAGSAAAWLAASYRLPSKYSSMAPGPNWARLLRYSISAASCYAFSAAASAPG